MLDATRCRNGVYDALTQIKQVRSLIEEYA